MLKNVVTALLCAMTVAVALAMWIVASLALARLALWLAGPLLGAA